MPNQTLQHSSSAVKFITYTWTRECQSVRFPVSFFQNVPQIGSWMERISFSIFRPTSFDLGSFLHACARAVVLTLENQGHLLSLPPSPLLLRLLHVGLKTRPEPGSLSEEHSHHASKERVNHEKGSAVTQQLYETYIAIYRDRQKGVAVC